MANYLEVPQPIIVEVKRHWMGFTQFSKDLESPAGLKFEERRSEACERKRVQIMGLKFSLSQCLSLSQLNILADLLSSSIRGTQRQFSENSCSEESLLGFRTSKKWYNCPLLTDFYPKKVI